MYGFQQQPQQQMNPFMVLQQPQQGQPNVQFGVMNNVENWLIQNISQQLTLAVTNGVVTNAMANSMMSLFKNNLKSYTNALANGTRGFTINMDNNSTMNFIAQVLQHLQKQVMQANAASMAQGSFIYGNLNNAYGSSANNIFSNTTAANLFTNNNPQQNQGQPQNAGYQNGQTIDVTQIQEQMNNMAAQTKQIQDAAQNQNIQHVNQTSPIEDVAVDDAPFTIVRDGDTPFDPEVEATWGYELISKVSDIKCSSSIDAVKNLAVSLAKSEAYWKSKGIDWELTCNPLIAMNLKNKKVARQALPKSTSNNIPNSNLTAVVPGDTIFSDDTCVSVNVISNEDGTLFYYIRMTHPDIVWHEMSYLEACGNGALKDLELRGTNGQITISPNQETKEIAVDIAYTTARVIRVPLDTLSPYLDQIKSITNKYLMSYEQEFTDFYEEITDLLYTMPRWISEKLDKFIVDYVNNMFSRNMRNLEKLSIRYPRINNWKNIEDLFEESPHNRLQKGLNINSYRRLLASFVYSSVVNSVVAPAAVTSQLEIAKKEHIDDEDRQFLGLTILNPEVQKVLHAHLGSQFQKIGEHIFDNQIKSEDVDMEHVRALCDALNTITIQPIAKNVCITTMVMDKAYIGAESELIMVPADRHLTPFETMIYTVLQQAEKFKDLMIIDRKDYTCLKGPFAYYKLIQSIDAYIGYSRHPI